MVATETYIDSAEVHSQLQPSLEAVHSLVQVVEQNTKKLHMMGWVKQNKQMRKKKRFCPVILAAVKPLWEILHQQMVDLLCKGTKNQERLSHWEVKQIIQRTTILDRPIGGWRQWPAWICLSGSPIQPMRADGNSGCQAHHTSRPAIIIPEQLTSGPQ